jgi:hypothetical protein
VEGRRGRERSVRYRVLDKNAERVRLRVEGTVKTAANVWTIDGEIDVSCEDGLSGEAWLRERGPGAPAVNERQHTGST